MARIEARLQKLPVEPMSLAAYEGIAPPSQLTRAREKAGVLEGARVLFVSSAPSEPSDVSRTVVRLLAGLGVTADRALLHGDRAFSRVARGLAEGLAGADCRLADETRQELREASEAAALQLDTRPYDAVITHGAGAAALVEGRRSERSPWVWRTGRDISGASRDAWATVAPLLDAHAAIDLSLAAFAHAAIPAGRLRVTPGAFDPRAPTQADPVPGTLAGLDGTGVDLSRPIVSQIGRLDASADPLAALETWRLAREEVPGLQLAIAGRIDPSDPDSVTVLDEVRAFAAGEPGLVVATDRSGATEAQIGAIGRVSRCALPASLADEFDPEVSAALWRGTPVIAEGLGARAQVRDGVNGHHVSGVRERATRVIELASDPRRGAAMGRTGRRNAVEDFAITRLLGDELELLAALTGAGRGRSNQSVAA